MLLLNAPSPTTPNREQGEHTHTHTDKDNKMKTSIKSLHIAYTKGVLTLPIGTQTYHEKETKVIARTVYSVHF